MNATRILVIENSVFFRKELCEGLFGQLPAGSLVESTSDPIDALEKVRLFQPTAIVGNISMSAISLEGKYFFPVLAERSKVPIIAYGILPEARDAALRIGATDYVIKPSDNGEMPGFFRHLAAVVRREAETKPSGHVGLSPSGSGGARSARIQPGTVMTLAHWQAAHQKSSPQQAAHTPPKASAPTTTAKPPDNLPTTHNLQNHAKITLIAVGSSTGGTEALSTVFKELVPPLPGIVVAQHIPALFAKLFADRLNTECALTVKEGEDGEAVQHNTIYIAPGNKHMTVVKSAAGYTIKCGMGPKVHSCRPSVDVLFNSVADNVGGSALGVILTGMGQDGADGLLRMRQKGSPTLGQDEATCVVYGMPRVAFEKGAVEKQLPLQMIASAIMQIARL